jgi:hypothetical protein
MATLGSPSPPSSPSRTMRRRGWARKVERYCCNTITYFPLAFVYGLTSWAVWVQAGIGFVPSRNAWTGMYFHRILYQGDTTRHRSIDVTMQRTGEGDR